MRSRAGRFASDIEHLGALGDKRVAVIDRTNRVSVTPAVVERIRGDVDDPAHQDGGFAETTDESVPGAGEDR
jgi:hypothetical protein